MGGLIYLSIQDSQARIVRSIIVEGNQRISSDTIKLRSNIQEGRNLNNEQINSTLKELYETEYFENVDIKQKRNGDVIIEVKENPIVKEVIFDGNKKLSKEILESEIILKKREVFTKAKLQSDLKRIKELYVKSGRFLATVEAKVTRLEQNRVRITFNVDEGKRAKVRDIVFIGNEAFTNDALREAISTKEARWYSFSSGEYYDEDRIAYDMELLRRFYTSKGYGDFEISSYTAQINDNLKDFTIKFVVNEGQKYTVGNVEVSNNIEDFDATKLEKALEIKSGKVYNSEKVERSIREITKILGENGYPFVNVRAVENKNKEQGIIDVKFIISESSRYYINKINIYGNTRTLDTVIRRNLTIKEGDAYDTSKIQESQRRLRNLGFFSKVSVDVAKTEDFDRVDINIFVEEQKTGEMNIGIGYSTVDELVLNLSVKEKNLLGTGKELGVSIKKATYNQGFDVTYATPYFMNKDLRAGFNVYYDEDDDQDTVDYNNKTYGASVFGDYMITENLKHQLRYSYEKEDISNVGSEYAGILLEEETDASILGHTLLYDKRDNRFDPTEGYHLKLSQDLAGLGGDKEYIKNVAGASWYKWIGRRDVVFKLSAKGGFIEGLGGEDVRSTDGFYLGGNSLRGFEYGGIGPRTISSTTGSPEGGNSVGGKYYYVGSAELKFPLGLPKELGINGSVFINAGTVTEVDNAYGIDEGEVEDSGSIRSAVGFGVAWKSPLGPIRFDFTETLSKEDYDIDETFRFSLGGSF